MPLFQSRRQRALIGHYGHLVLLYWLRCKAHGRASYQFLVALSSFLHVRLIHPPFSKYSCVSISSSSALHKT